MTPPWKVIFLVLLPLARVRLSSSAPLDGAEDESPGVNSLQEHIQNDEGKEESGKMQDLEPSITASEPLESEADRQVSRTVDGKSLYGCRSGELKPVFGHGNQYEICYNGQWWIMRCPENGIFDVNIQLCVIKTGVTGKPIPGPTIPLVPAQAATKIPISAATRIPVPVDPKIPISAAPKIPVSPAPKIPIPAAPKIPIPAAPKIPVPAPSVQYASPAQLPVPSVPSAPAAKIPGGMPMLLIPLNNKAEYAADNSEIPPVPVVWLATGTGTGTSTAHASSQADSVLPIFIPLPPSRPASASAHAQTAAAAALPSKPTTMLLAVPWIPGVPAPVPVSWLKPTQISIPVPAHAAAAAPAPVPKPVLVSLPQQPVPAQMPALHLVPAPDVQTGFWQYHSGQLQQPHARHIDKLLPPIPPPTSPTLPAAPSYYVRS